MAKAITRPAATYTITSDAALLLALLKRFSAVQLEELTELMGALYKPSLVGVELMRHVCLSAARGETKHVAALQRDLKAYGGKATIWRALRVLEQASLVVIGPDPARPRVDQVQPSDKLAAFYNRGAPEVLRELRRALAA